jgi:hypothetical protein
MKSSTSILTRIVSTVRISSDNEKGDDEKIGQDLLNLSQCSFIPASNCTRRILSAADEWKYSTAQ